MKIKILIPVYNDWPSVFKLLENIDYEISDIEYEISIIIVNDKSSEKRPEFSSNLNNIKNLKIINMEMNRGHARCIAAGLKYINEKENFDYIIPMDGDGEDRPEEIKMLVTEIKNYPDTIVTANRIKRSEGFLFKTGYQIHKYLTYIFTGQSIKFGNYTCLPKSIVIKMINEAATWSSFSGSLAKLSKDRRSIPSIRGTRYFGPSKMSYINLLKHSLSIISVFRKIVLMRSIIFLAVYSFLVSQYLTVVTLIPILLIIVMLLLIFFLSGRENIKGLNNSLDNVTSIENLK
tara:strand:- start:1267 stop:2136 length:870 start_codon:yes stop_codon:yes gene_type:complete